MPNKSDEKALIFKSGRYYWCKCEECGWEDSSEYLLGGGAIADTGDYDDVYCPICGCTNLDGDSKYVTEDTYADQIVEIPLREILEPYLKEIRRLHENCHYLHEQLDEFKNKFGDL